MRILQKHKILWISKPKTGSTSVRKLLDRFGSIRSTSERPFHHHATYPELRAAFADKGWNIDEYQVYVCDRNPWALVASLWKYARTNAKYQHQWDKDYDASSALLSFAEFLALPRTWKWLRERHALEVYTGSDPLPANMHVYDIGSQSGQLLTDLSSAVGKPLEDLGQHNSSTYADDDMAAIRATYADPVVADRMAKTFATSIRRFGYRNPFA